VQDLWRAAFTGTKRPIPTLLFMAYSGTPNKQAKKVTVIDYNKKKTFVKSFK